jgi:small subunit ribosomal protein S1
MKHQPVYLPEGYTGKHIIPAHMEDLKKALRPVKIMEGLVTRCDAFRNLFVTYGLHVGMIPWNETCIGAKEGKIKDIAVISFGGKAHCFKSSRKRKIKSSVDPAVAQTCTIRST